MSLSAENSVVAAIPVASTVRPADVAPGSHVASSFPAPRTAPTPAPPAPTPAASMNPAGGGETRQVRQNTEVTDTSLDEGPAYDGSGGMGLAKGTANTYIIPGMDEMSPEEYRKALQKSVSDRQSRRHDNRQGVVGNRAALQYLDTLGWGGASSNWKKEEE